MKPLATLVSAQKFSTRVGYDFTNSIEKLAAKKEVDALIVSTENGFSPLGAARAFLAADLGIPENEIVQLADRNRFDNPMVTLVALKSRRPDSLLRGLILAPGETSRCYSRFGIEMRTPPSRDFYYNVTYEAIAHACNAWKARRLGITHLSASGNFHRNIATCNAEALAHFCDEAIVSTIESFAFVGCCITVEHLEGIRRLNPEGNLTQHRPINLEREVEGEVEFIHLSWE